MTTYGTKQEPGITTDLTSSAAVPTSGEAPSNPGYVGQADLENANDPADTGKVYQVTRASKAVDWFGPMESSLLTNAVVDALNEGAYPVYAVATPEETISGEVHDSASTTTVTTDKGPLREDAKTTNVILDSTELDINIVRDEVDTYEPEDGECYVNPVRSNIELPSTPSNSLSIGYDTFDYESAIDVMANNVADTIDFLFPLSEKSSVVDKANVTVATLEDQYDLVLCVGGADINIPDVTNFEQQYDDSRTQVVYPTRFEDGTSAVAAVVGQKAQLGLGSTPINRRLSTNKSLDEELNKAQRGTLNDVGVVPLADEARGVRVTDDPTTVSEGNTDEKNLNYGFNRLLADYIIETTRDNEKPFIGKLNSQTVRNTLESMVDEQLSNLQESDVVISYDVNILKEDAVTVGLEMQVDLVEPLRFIDNTVTITN